MGIMNGANVVRNLTRDTKSECRIALSIVDVGRENFSELRSSIFIFPATSNFIQPNDILVVGDATFKASINFVLTGKAYPISTLDAIEDVHEPKNS